MSQPAATSPKTDPAVAQPMPLIMHETLPCAPTVEPRTVAEQPEVGAGAVVADALASVLSHAPAGDSSSPRERVDINQENVGKGLAQLVLTVVRLLHELLEKQALRRMDAGTLTEPEIERLGTTLRAQSREIREMAERFGIDERDLNLDLGPLGKAL